ncbi:MAG: hypothetical protein JST38_19270, partial [Bacteroidetes bacterium]|nr:hypothetical protein [Bacteroidota bacterium]
MWTTINGRVQGQTPLLLLTLAACTATQPAISGNEDYYSQQEIRYADHVYTPTVHTVQLFKKGFEL